MRKNSHGRILREELKEQHLNTIPKSYPNEWPPKYYTGRFCKIIYLLRALLDTNKFNKCTYFMLHQKESFWNWVVLMTMLSLKRRGMEEGITSLLFALMLSKWATFKGRFALPNTVQQINVNELFMGCPNTIVVMSEVHIEQWVLCLPENTGTFFMNIVCLKASKYKTIFCHLLVNQIFSFNVYKIWSKNCLMVILHQLFKEGLSGCT